MELVHQYDGVVRGGGQEESLLNALVYVQLHDVGEGCDEHLEQTIKEGALLLVLLDDVTEAVLDLLEGELGQLESVLGGELTTLTTTQVEVGAHLLDIF